MNAAAPLEGIRVADFSRVLAGPFATMMLGDLGADVIKVERPGEGDETRTWGPPFAGGESTYYLAINRNKRSIALDLSRPDHVEVAHRLIERSDIAIENFRPGTADRIGIGYERARELNPRIVYASVTGFGDTGPLRDRPGYDFVAQAMGGVMSVTGERDGDPMKVGVAVADITSGMYSAIGILAALHRAQRTGKGSHVHVSLLESQIGWLANQASNHLNGGVDPVRMGNLHPNIVPYRVFHASDATLVVAVPNEGQWRRLCSAIGREELRDDPRFARNADRVRHRETLEPLLEAVFASKTREQWIDLLAAAEVPCGPINTIPEVFADEQVQALGMVQESPHPTAGTVRTVRTPIGFDAEVPQVRRAPPLLGADTREVLGALGYSGEEVARLMENPWTP